ncbi:MAG: ATP-binding cassette domain-containing protein [Syntrophomonadaceae bacterium]|jgi:molybdate transport system ATP-binding protein|nr:ATP-binding cassette domain-containing protein [Syntrophomonadaceae bacterium]
MSLEVDIVKNFEGFTLKAQFSAGNEIMGFLGASGSGKSMTLKCIAGVVTPDQGTITIDGMRVFDSAKGINIPPQKRQVGYLFQSSSLFPNMTAEQNILCVMKNTGDHKTKRSKVRDYMAMMGLEGLYDRYPSELSGGQQQRVALARILLLQPKIIMLDEPFSALDSYLRWQLEQELASVLGNFGGTSIFVSHNRDEIYRLCDTVAVVSDGAVDRIQDKWSLYENPKSYDACLLTGCKNISSARPVDNGILAEEWGITLFCGDKITKGVKYVGIRSHDIMLTDNPTLPNTFEIEVVNTMRDTFSYVILVRKKGSSILKTLRLEANWDRSDTTSSLPHYAHIPPEKVLLLYS